MGGQKVERRKEMCEMHSIYVYVPIIIKWQGKPVRRQKKEKKTLWNNKRRKKEEMITRVYMKKAIELLYIWFKHDMDGYRAVNVVAIIKCASFSSSYNF